MIAWYRDSEKGFKAYGYGHTDIIYGGVYSLSEDDFLDYTDKTNKNFQKMGIEVNGKLDKNPFFTYENSYFDVECLIREKRIIESKDNVPIEQTIITFYDEENQVIKKDAKLNSSKIIIKLTCKDSEVIMGETPFLKYKIPLFDMQMINKQDNKFANFDIEPTGY